MIFGHHSRMKKSRINQKYDTFAMDVLKAPLGSS